jgi:hypothetical protein
MAYFAVLRSWVAIRVVIEALHSTQPERGSSARFSGGDLHRAGHLRGRPGFVFSQSRSVPPCNYRMPRRDSQKAVDSFLRLVAKGVAGEAQSAESTELARGILSLLSMQISWGTLPCVSFFAGVSRPTPSRRPSRAMPNPNDAGRYATIHCVHSATKWASGLRQRWWHGLRAWCHRSMGMSNISATCSVVAWPDQTPFKQPALHRA